MIGSTGKQIVVFLDYDGTLSPIVEDPDQAFMTNEVCHLPRIMHQFLCSQSYNHHIKKNFAHQKG